MRERQHLVYSEVEPWLAAGRDLLRPVFLTRSGGVQMEAGELSEAEVELEVVEPWDTRVNMFGA